MIKQAIIPLAGLGTRMLPLTSVMAKELLPINGKPNLEYIIEECIGAGIKEFIFIISKKKQDINDIKIDLAKNFNKAHIDCYADILRKKTNIFTINNVKDSLKSVLSLKEQL